MDIYGIIYTFLAITICATLQGAVGYGLNIIAAPLLMLFSRPSFPGRWSWRPCS